jgi:enoyl-CoA hydratase
MRVTLNGPGSLNALNPKMVEELGVLFTDLYAREEARVGVLRGAGRAFCAGLDLKAFGDGDKKATMSAGLATQRPCGGIYAYRAIHRRIARPRDGPS